MGALVDRSAGPPLLPLLPLRYAVVFGILVATNPTEELVVVLLVDVVEVVLPVVVVVVVVVVLVVMVAVVAVAAMVVVGDAVTSDASVGHAQCKSPALEKQALTK